MTQTHGGRNKRERKEPNFVMSWHGWRVRKEEDEREDAMYSSAISTIRLFNISFKTVLYRCMYSEGYIMCVFILSVLVCVTPAGQLIVRAMQAGVAKTLSLIFLVRSPVRDLHFREWLLARRQRES